MDFKKLIKQYGEPPFYEDIRLYPKKMTAKYTLTKHEVLLISCLDRILNPPQKFRNEAGYIFSNRWILVYSSFNSFQY